MIVSPDRRVAIIEPGSRIVLNRSMNVRSTSKTDPLLVISLIRLSILLVNYLILGYRVKNRTIGYSALGRALNILPRQVHS